MSIMWEIYLNRYFCKADEYTGNRPCDSGMSCDACHGENVQADYEAFKRNFSLVETAIKDAKVGKLYTVYQRWYYDVLGQTFVIGKEFNTMEEAYDDFWERLREEHKAGV